MSWQYFLYLAYAILFYENTLNKLYNSVMYVGAIIVEIVFKYAYEGTPPFGF